MAAYNNAWRNHYFNMINPKNYELIEQTEETHATGDT